MSGGATEADYDVVIVGGGPGGATASHRLQSFGLDTLIVDKATFPRHKLCGGLLTDKTLRLVERVFGQTESMLQDRDVLNFSADVYEAYFRDERLIRDDFETPFYFVERSVYDEFLFREALDAGATAVEGDGVDHIEIDDGVVVTESGRRFGAEYIVAADGANSVVRRQLFESGALPSDGWSENLAIAVETYVPREDVTFDPDYPVIHFGVVEWGYGWVFPNREQLVVGVGGLNRKNGNFRSLLEDYLEYLGYDDAAGRIYGHPIPFGNYRERPAHGNVLLVGDAAGTVDAITGEGIFYAQRSGELAAWAIHRAVEGGPTTSVADHYTRLLDAHVRPEMVDSKRARLALWAGPELPRRLLMRAWISVLSDPVVELVHGKRVYRWLASHGEQLHDTVT